MSAALLKLLHTTKTEGSLKKLGFVTANTAGNVSSSL